MSAPDVGFFATGENWKVTPVNPNDPTFGNQLWTNTVTGQSFLADATGKRIPSASVPQGVPVQQAPGIFPTRLPYAVTGTIGSSVPPREFDPLPRPLEVGPVFALPPGQQSTTSKQSGDNPGPVPPVGSLPPRSSLGTDPFSNNYAAPSVGQSNWKVFAVMFGVLIGLWAVAGYSFKEVL